ncbi:MAG TPA: hypothetical protein GX710_08515 [Clostridiales bacterium]|nr:hypothetical protein [Clostridiales bacterium]
MGNEMQCIYWNQMSQYKFCILCYNEHFSRYVSGNRKIMIVLAVLSSGAVAGWAIWNKFSFIWAIIVASTQVLTIINEFLPYKSRIKEIPELVCKLEIIYDEMEREWYSIASGEVENAEINNALYKYKEKWRDVSGKYFTFDALPDKECIKNKANKLKQEYYKNLFEGDVNNAIQQQTEQHTNT